MRKKVTLICISKLLKQSNMHIYGYTSMQIHTLTSSPHFSQVSLYKIQRKYRSNFCAFILYYLGEGLNSPVFKRQRSMLAHLTQSVRAQIWLIPRNISLSDRQKPPWRKCYWRSWHTIFNYFKQKSQGCQIADLGSFLFS